MNEPLPAPSQPRGGSYHASMLPGSAVMKSGAAETPRSSDKLQARQGAKRFLGVAGVAWLTAGYWTKRTLSRRCNNTVLPQSGTWATTKQARIVGLAWMRSLTARGSVFVASVLPRAPEAGSTAALRAALAEPAAVQRRNCNTACNQLHSGQRTDAPSPHHGALFLKKAFRRCAPDTHSFLLDGIS